MPPKKKPQLGAVTPKGHRSLLISSSVLGEEKFDLTPLKAQGFVMASLEDDKVRMAAARIHWKARQPLLTSVPGTSDLFCLYLLISRVLTTFLIFILD